MTEEPAPRAPQAPHATQTPAPARGEGPGPDRPPQGDTALRDRIASAIGSTMILRTSVDEIAEAVMEVVHPHLKSLVDAPKEVGDSGGISERLDAALRTVGLARNLAAYRDVVLPVVEEALAEQRKRLRAVPEEHRCESVHPDRDLRCTRASDHVAHVNGGDGWSCACDLTTERAEQAETERAALADRNRDLDAQLTRERQKRLAAEAEARIAHTDLGKERATIGRLTAELRAVEIDRDQWRDRAHALRAEVSDDPTAATYGGYLQRAEDAEDRLRKAEQAYMQLAEHHTDIKEHVAATQSRFAQIEKLIAAAQQRADQADAALQRVQDALAPSPEGAAFAIHTGGAGETTVQVVVPRDAIRAALDADQPKDPT